MALRTKRILYVTPFDEPLSGADESLLLALSRLDRARFEPFVLAIEGSHYAARYEQAGVRVFPWPMSRLRRSYSLKFWMGYLSKLRRELRDIPEFLKEQGIDLVHINMHVCIGTLLSANRLGIPVVTHYRSKTNDRPKIFYDLFLPWLYRRSAAILCISEAVARHFISRGLPTKVRVVSNPIDLDKFQEPNGTNYFSSYPRFDGKKIILFVGRIHPQKQIHILIEAVRLLTEKERSYALAIVGEAALDFADQEYAEDIRRKVSAPDFPAPVEWIPRQQNVAPMMNSADVFVLPSVDEGFGRVVVEAMASGVPVIGADSGAIPELIGPNEYGQLVPPGRPGELAKAIDRALKDSHWKDVALKAQEHALKCFSVSEHVRALEETYDVLLSA